MCQISRKNNDKVLSCALKMCKKISLALEIALKEVANHRCAWRFPAGGGQFTNLPYNLPKKLRPAGGYTGGFAPPRTPMLTT